MDFNNLIEARRSMRAFDPNKNLSKEQIEQLIYSAIQAPSWKNSQTARYHCIISQDKIESFKKECLPEFNTKNCTGASALIVATFVTNRAGFDKETASPVNELGNGWGIYDLGLQNENLILKAKDMGIDTLIMGIRNEVKIKEMLNIPLDECIVSVIALGYGTKEAIKPKRKEPQDILKFY